MLPSHKDNQFFEGSIILVEAQHHSPCPHSSFLKYIDVRDSHFLFHPQLWPCEDGQVPTNSWEVQQMKAALSDNVVGHSLWSGGMTALAISSTPDDHIQARVHWSSDAYAL